MKNEKLTPISTNETAGRFYKNVSEPRLVGEVIKEVLTHKEQENRLDSLIKSSTLIKRELMETPEDKRSPIAVALWESYKTNCLFYEAFEDYIWRLKRELGTDFLFKMGIA